jgi:transketolase
VPDIILIATGSEVALAVGAAQQLAADGVQARVVSMPCTDAFEHQSDEYKQAILPPAVTARVVIEAGVSDGWWRHAGPGGRVIGMDSFGESAPAEELFRHFGFTVENVSNVARQVLAGQ